MNSRDSAHYHDARVLESGIVSSDAVALVDALPTAVYICDLEGYLTSYNRAASKLWGRCPVIGKDRWSGSSMLLKADGQPLSAQDSPIAVTLRSLEPVKGSEMILVTPDGSRRNVMAYPQLLHDGEGRFTGAMEMLVDITEQKQAEAEQRLSELKFRALVTKAPVGIFLSDPNGDALFVNQKWCEMAGMRQEDALGAGWISAIHPDDVERITSGWDHAVEGQASSINEFRFLKPDGSVTWIQGIALPLEDDAGGFNGYIGSCVDITQRRRAEEILASLTSDSERKRRLYEGILSTTPDLAYVFDRNHKFIFANKALLGMWGNTWEESAGKSFLDLGYEPWHAEMHDREIEEVIATKQPIRGEVPFPHESSGVRIYDYIFSPVLDASGEVEMIAGTTRDVTDRKDLEDRATFLSELGGTLAALGSDEEIIAAVAEAVGKKLHANRCCFVECTEGEEHLNILKNWVFEETEDIGGSLPLEDLGGKELWAVGPVIVNNVKSHPLTSAAPKEFLARGIRSFASQTLRAGPTRTVTLLATCERPRPWVAWESALLEHVLPRVWPMVERARSERALRESRQRLRLVSDHVPSLISHLDENAVFRFANARFREWFGVDPEKLVGTPLSDLLPPEIMAQRRAYIERVLTGEPVAFEGITVHHKMGRRNMHVSYDPDFGPDGKVRGFYMMSLDITDRKKAEQLLERRAVHSNILREAAGVILNADEPDGMLQKVFGKISELLEVDAFLNFMVKPDGDGLELVSSHGISETVRAGLTHLDFGQAICGTVAASRKSMVRECIHQSDDEMAQLVRTCGFRAYACNPLVAGERLLGTLSFASSTRERFEADEIEFMETISHYVTGAYVRHQLLENLRLADRRKDEFLATLAHELRNPLAPIRTGLEIMKMNAGPAAADDRIRSMMERQVEQLIALVNDLLDVSRITRGKLELRKSKVDLAESVRSAAEASLPSINEAGQKLQVLLPGPSVYLDADPNRLAQIISNLLNNASRYSQSGTTILLEVTVNEKSLLLRVVDQGVGLAPGMLHQIFEMFTQVNAISGQNSGLGIGLTLVKSLVEMHGGSVWADSDGLGHGSTFNVRLPVSVSAGETTPSNPDVWPVEATSGLKVLVIDDNKPAAQTLSMALEMMGHEVRTAFSGPEGIGIATTFNPGLIFLDLGMPDMDGCETARRIRDIEGGMEIILVALTGWGQDAARKRSSESGFNHHLVKPANLKDLRELIAKL